MSQCPRFFLKIEADQIPISVQDPVCLSGQFSSLGSHQVVPLREPIESVYHQYKLGIIRWIHYIYICIYIYIIHIYIQLDCTFSIGIPPYIYNIIDNINILQYIIYYIYHQYSRVRQVMRGLYMFIKLFIKQISLGEGPLQGHFRPLILTQTGPHLHFGWSSALMVKQKKGPAEMT